MKKIISMCLLLSFISLQACTSTETDNVYFSSDAVSDNKNFNYSNCREIYYLASKIKCKIYMNEKEIPHNLKMELLSDLNIIIETTGISKITR